jgi:autotransporter-associated beta strand protein
MNPKTSITQNFSGGRSWLSCLRLLVALVLLGWGAVAQAANFDVWTNQAGNNTWSVTNNWLVNGNPALGLTNTGGDSLTFGPMGINATYRATNDFTAGLLTIGSITFATNGYYIGGNALYITNGITDNYGSNNISLAFTLIGSQTFQNTVNPLGQTNTQTTLVQPLNLGNSSNTLTFSGGGNFNLNGTGLTASEVVSGTNGGGMIEINNSGGIVRLGPTAGSTGNFFGSNTVSYMNLTTNAYYATNLFNFQNVVIYATNTVNTNVIVTTITNSINAYGNGYSYVSSNTVYTFQTNSQYFVQDVVKVDNGTLQAATTAAAYIPTGAGVGNVSVDGTWDLNGYGPTINGLEDTGTGYGIVDNIGSTLTGTYTLTIGNASSNGVFNGTIKNTSGTVAVNKIGYGVEVFNNGNYYSGQTTISQGMLMISNNLGISAAGSLGQNSTLLSIQSGAVLDVTALNGATPPGYYPLYALTVAAGTPGKPYTNFYGSYFPFSPATTNYVVTISSTNTLVSSVISNAYTAAGAFIGSFTNLTTNYTTIVYATNSIVNVINYDVNGDFSVTGGGAISPIATATYAATPASVSPSAVPGIATWSINGNLSFDESANALPNRVNFLLNNVTPVGGGTNDLIDVSGQLFIGDELDVAISALTGSLVSGGGKYTLFRAAGGYVGHGNPANNGDTDVANIVPIAPRGITASISSDATNVYLTASGTVSPGQIIWQGTPAHNNWDVDLTQNWKTNGTFTPSAQYYFSGDNVTFDDTGVGSVNLPVVQTPGSVTFNNNKTNYAFVASSGTFIGGNGGLTLNGSGTVTLNNPNSFTGPVTINNGTLICGNYNGYGDTLLYNGVAPGQLIFGNGGQNEIFQHNWSLANTGQGGFFSGFTLNSGANAQIGSVGGRGANVTEYLVIGDNITRNIGSSIYFGYGIRSGSLSTLYFTNDIPWTNGVMFAGYGHTGTDWVQGQTNYPGGANASYSYAGYSNNFPAAAWLPTNNVTNNMEETATTLTLPGSSSIFTLKVVGPSTITIPSGATLTNVSGGLLISSASTGPSTILGGTNMGAAGQDLIILQNYTTSPFYIGSVIADNGSATALTLGGLGGTVIITNTATYTGATYINSGTLQIGNGAALGSIASSSVIYDLATLAFNRPDSVFQGTLNGIGNLTQNGTGSLILTGDNGLSGTVTINSGTLQLGNGAAAGSFTNAAAIVDKGTLTIDTTGDTSYPGVISGSGNLVMSGSGIFDIATNETYSGNTIVSNGTLKVVYGSGSISNTASIIVNQGANFNVDPAGNGTLTLRGTLPAEILAGNGTVQGSVATTVGTTITPGTNGVVGSLTITNNLNFNGGVLAMDVGTNANDHIYVGGQFNETGGLVVVNILNTLTNGVYNLVVATNGLNGTTAANLAVYVPGIPLGTLAVLTNAAPNTLDLLVYSGFSTALYWRGDGTQNYWNSSAGSIWVDGGNNTKLYASADIVNFDDNGNSAIPVSLNASSVFPTAVNVLATNDNYTIGDGTQANAGNLIGGGSSLTKTGSGLLTIQNLNNYVGATVINSGTVQLNGAGTSIYADGLIGNNNVITNNGTLIANNATNETINGAIAGSGLLVQQGVGKLILTGNDSAFSGPVSITNSLQVGNGITGVLGTGPVTNNGTLILDVNGSVTVANDISGSGSVSNIAGTVTLSGTNTYGGATAASGGTLKVGGTNAIPGTTSLIVNDNTNGASSVGTFDLNGNTITVASLLGSSTGSGTAAIVQGTILNNGSTTNVINISGGTNSLSANILDNNNNGGITGPNHGAVGLALLGGQLTLWTPFNAALAATPNVFGGGASGPGITISNATLIVTAGNVNTTDGNAGTQAIGGNPAGTQNITMTGTNANLWSGGSQGSNGSTEATAAGNLTVGSNTWAYIYGPQRGLTSYATLNGPTNATIVYQTDYVRGEVNFGVTTNFFGTIIFGQWRDTSGGNLGLQGNGLPNANVVLGNTNYSGMLMGGAVGGGVFYFGSLSGGDNSFTLAGGAQPSGDGNASCTYAIGGLNETNVVGAIINDTGEGIRKIGTGTLTLTNNVMSYAGATVVSNGILAYAPLGNYGTFFGTLGFNPLTNNFLVGSNYTIVSPGVLDLSQVPTNTLYLISSVRAQTLYGNGTLNGNLIVTNAIVAPGKRAWTTNNFSILNAGGLAFWPSSLTVNSNAVFGTNSTIMMSFGTNGYDNLNVLGTLTIQQAALTVVSNGPIPFAAQTTNVFRFFSNSVNVALGALSGGITNITVQALPPGMYWLTNLNGTLAGYPTIPAGAMAIYNSNQVVSANVLLKGLVVTPLGALTPAFTSNTFSYTAVEAYTGTPITVSPTNWDTTASNRVIYLGVTNGVGSGVPSTSMALNANPNSNNVVVIKVTGSDNLTVTNYTVTVTRNPSRTPGAIVDSFQNGGLTLSWPLSQNGYQLQAQTNPLTIGLSNNWTVVAGSTLTNTYTNTINPNNPSVFYRLINTNSP